MKANLSLFAILGTCFISAGSSSAIASCDDEPDCADIPYLKEIFVTSTRTETNLLYNPNAVAIVDEEDMKWNANESLAEVLRDIPGVTVVDSGQAGMKRIRIRGEESYRVAILIDGQEVTDHRGEGVPLTLDPALIERIEVVKGSGSVLYGPRALGGVINFITRKGGDRPLQVTASTGWDTASEGEQHFISAYGSVNDFDYRVSASKEQQGNRHTPAGEIDNTESESDSLTLYLGKQWNDHHLSLSLDDHNANADVFVEDEVRFSFPFTEFILEIPQRDRRKVGVFYDWSNVSDHLHKVHVDAYRQVSDRQFRTYWEQGLFNMEKDVFSESELETVGTTAQLDWYLGANHHLITGAQYSRDQIKQDRLEQLTFTAIPLTLTTEIFDKAELETTALFLQDEWQLNDTVAITAGARQYWVNSELVETTRVGLTIPDKEDSELIYSLAAVWEASQNSVLRVAYSEGYIYPSLLQLAIGGVERTFVNPDPDLKPEQSKTWELGWRYSGEKLQLDTTLFTSHATNYIDHVPCGASPKCTVAGELYVNIGESESYGFEGYMEYLASHAFKPYTSITWLRRENHFDTFSTYDSGLPNLRGRVGLKYNRSYDHVRYWADAYLRAETEAVEVEEDMTRHHNSGWTTYNLKMGWAFGEMDRYRLILELRNLSDKKYSTAAENIWAAERSILAKVAVDF